MVVIVSYFYWKQENHFTDPQAVTKGIDALTDWLLATGHQNIIVEIANEVGDWFHHDDLKPAGIHRAIERAKSRTHNGRRLLVGASTLGGQSLPTEAWMAASDLVLPHGNGLDAAGLAVKLQSLRAREDFRKRPMPIVINEDSSALANLEVAVDHGVSWGYYHQGNGSYYEQKHDINWKGAGREASIEALSGFQTMPVNWNINTPAKRAFFDRVREMTGGC
jgi:hypothetical protein